MKLFQIISPDQSALNSMKDRNGLIRQI